MKNLNIELQDKYEMGNSLVHEYDMYLEEKHIGYAEVIVDENDEAVINDIVIYEEYRNNGLGTETIKHFAKEFGGVYLAPTDENNQRLYARLGKESGYEYGIDQGFGVYYIE